MKEIISKIAYKAMLEEVYTTPKPGLVDRDNNGSHKDMCVATFERSAKAIAPYFGECYEAGCLIRENKGNIANIVRVIRPIGIEAEKAMYEATGGVNTHKGIIFSLGILCAALGYDSENVWDVVALIGEEILKADFEDSSINDVTAGEKQYKSLGLTGIRGEVASGMPTLRRNLLCPFSFNINENTVVSEDIDETLLCLGARQLLYVIASLKDSNMIKRSSYEEAERVRLDIGEELARLEAEGVKISEEYIKNLDEMFISRNLSPGGAADQLILMYFMHNCC